jgi:hypothetical protein
MHELQHQRLVLWIIEGGVLCSLPLEIDILTIIESFYYNVYLMSKQWSLGYHDIRQQMIQLYPSVTLYHSITATAAPSVTSDELPLTIVNPTLSTATVTIRRRRRSSILSLCFFPFFSLLTLFSFFSFLLIFSFLLLFLFFILLYFIFLHMYVYKDIMMMIMTTMR